MCCRTKVNFITMFSSKTPQIAVDLYYTILQNVCTVTVSVVHLNNVGIMVELLLLHKLRTS